MKWVLVIVLFGTPMRMDVPPFDSKTGCELYKHNVIDTNDALKQFRIVCDVHTD